MEIIDSVVKLATEVSTKAISERVIRLDRLVISLNKIIRSFKVGAINPEAPQVVHLQNIENIFYHDPQLFDDTLMDSFFSIKDELDSGAKALPLAGAEYEALFSNILSKVTNKRNHQRKMARRVAIVVWIIIAMIAIWTLLVGAAIGKSKWNELWDHTPTVAIQPSQIGQRTLVDSTGAC